MEMTLSTINAIYVVVIKCNLAFKHGANQVDRLVPSMH